MSRKCVSSLVLLCLIVAGLALPIAICVVLALGSLLSVMGDSVGGAVLRYVALAGGVCWIVVLISLIFVQAVCALGRPDEDDQ